MTRNSASKALLGILLSTLLLTTAQALPHQDLIDKELNAWREPIVLNTNALSERDERVIITLKDPTTLPRAGRDAERLNAQERRALGESMRSTIAQRREVRPRHSYNSINALAATVTPQERLILQHHPLVANVASDGRAHISMADTVDIINATGAWATQLNSTNITGQGQGVCIIDTGIDYTHPDLGGCAYTTLTHNGTEEAYSLASAHPYSTNYDNTWTITKPGYTRIAAHFTNISTEDGYDYVSITDAQGIEVARYSGSHADLWTPSIPGDTIKVRLISDSAVTDYGFAIDRVINGTTNATTNWQSCKTQAAWDFVNSDADPQDDHGHGTHVAGTVAANGGVVGVAPDAHLAVAKALDAGGSGWNSDIIAAIEWCTAIAPTHNITAISMSLGGGNFSGACDAALPYFASPINAATAQNISVVVATGNEGNYTHISAPACINKSIAVGSVSKSDVMSSFSNRNDQLKLVAPGESIVSTTPGGGTGSSSGTSMATPHVSGAIALLTQYLRLAGMEKTPSELEDALAGNGRAVTDALSGLTFTRIDIKQTIDAIDTAPPVTTDDAPTGWTNAAVNVTLTATDAGSGVAYTSYNLNSTGWQNGTRIEVNATGENNLTYYSVDALGNQETPRTTFIRIDRQAPSTLTDAQSGWQTITTVTLTPTDDLAGVSATWIGLDGGAWENATNITISTTGNHTLSYYSEDAAGNIEDVQNVSVAVDLDAPTTNDDHADAWHNQSYTITLTPIDAHSGVDTTSYHNGTWNNGTSILITAEGSHPITYRSTDRTGNTEANKTLTARLDATAPNSTDDAPSGWQTGPVTVTITSTDALSGVNHTTLRVDGGTWQNATSTQLSADGNHTIEYASTDNAGNTETARNTTILIDQTPPSINLTTITERIGQRENFTLTATANDTNLDAVTATLDNQTTTLTWNGTAYTAELTAGAAGASTLTLNATDLAGNTASQPTLVTVYDKQTLNATLENTTSLALNATLRANLTLAVNTTSQANITILTSTQTPGFVNQRPSAVRYLDIEASGVENMDWALITMSYDDAEIAGLDPTSLTMAWHNGTGWEDLDPAAHAWVHGVGHNAQTRTVYANVTHFSTYALVGAPAQEAIVEESSSHSGGGGGGGGGRAVATMTVEDNASEAFTLRYLSAGERVERVVERAELPITGFGFTSTHDVLIGTLTINKTGAPRIEGYTTHSAFIITSDIDAEDIVIAFDGIALLQDGEALPAENGAARAKAWGTYVVATPLPAAAPAENTTAAVAPSTPASIAPGSEEPQAVAPRSSDWTTALILVLVVAVSLAITVLLRSETRKKARKVRGDSDA